MVPIARVVIENDEIDAVVAVLRSGRLRAGTLCREFEERFAATVGARHAIAVSSGTAALHVAYHALLEPGDEVIVPAFTFAATATMISEVGATPVFADVDPQTLLLGPDEVRRALTPRTKALAPVHLYGNACDVAGLQAVAAEANLHIVWDAAQAHGTTFQGTDVGNFDDVVCYSFYPTKNMTTGEGGMVVTNDAALAERMRLFTTHGMRGKYNHVEFGLNYRLTDIAAAMGLRQLDKLAMRVERRQHNAAVLDEAIRTAPGLTRVVTGQGSGHSFHQYTLVLDPDILGCSRKEFQARLTAQGVESAVHYPAPVHLQPIYRATYGGVRLPVAEDAAGRVLSVPVHCFLSDEELAHVARSLVSAANETVA